LIEIRPIRSSELPEAKTFVPEGNAEPEWNNCWAVFWNNEMTHIFGMEQRLIVEPMYSKGNHTLAGFGAMTFIDGFLRAQGKPGYEFFVSDANTKFQDFIAKNLPVNAGREKPGKYFFRKFEV
jgi:hypothetical protein